MKGTGHMKCGLALRLALALALGLAIGLFAAPSPAHAERLEDIFARANAAYFRGDFAAAVTAYEQLEAAGVRDADVYVNLATAHARVGALGKAVLCFERALYLRPRDPSAEAGLRVTRALLASREADEKGEAELRTRPPLADALVQPFSADGLAVSLLLLDALLFALLAALALSPPGRRRVGLAILGSVVAIACLLAGAGLAVKLELFREGRLAIVLPDKATLREGPDPSAKPRGEARAGARARLLSRDLDHVLVRLDHGAEGWMNASDLAPLRPD